MSLYISCRPLLRCLPRSLHVPAKTMLPRGLSARYLQTPGLTSDKPADFAFIFDIDGVLMRGPNPIPNSTEALSLLSKNAVEFILFTNGGGKTESARAAELSERLNVPIDSAQFIQSHTPFAEFADKFETVLIIGGESDNCRHVAKEYGFRNVILPCDILAKYPAISPFSIGKTPEYAQPLPEGELKIDAIFVFNDSRDWARDIQLMIDFLLADEGRLGTLRPAGCDKPPVPLYFSNSDLIWVNDYHLPRMGQGSFRSAFSAAWKSVGRTQRIQLPEEMDKAKPRKAKSSSKRGGRDDFEEGNIQNNKGTVPRIDPKIFGKPHKPAYEFAETALCNWRTAQLKLAGGEEAPPDVKTIYMIGDNPAADIASTNFSSDRGVKWVSVLVKTGVYKDGNEIYREPNAVVGDVLDAVKWAFEKEREKAGGAGNKVEEGEVKEKVKEE